MSLTFVLRVLLLNPVILAGIFVLLLPLVIWRTHRFLAREPAPAPPSIGRSASPASSWPCRSSPAC